MPQRESGFVVCLSMVACLGALQCDESEDKEVNDGTGEPEDRETDSDTGMGTETEETGTGTETGETGTGEGEDIVIGTIAIPEAFDGDAVMLGTMFYADLLAGGMPDAIGDSLTDLEIVPGGTLPFTTSQAGLEGAYYLAVVLYCAGGGGGQFPVPGVDWIGGTAVPLTLGPGTGTVNAGDIGLFLAE
jgi:hypothetical protein